MAKIASFEPGANPAVWTGNYTNNFSDDITKYRMLIIWAEYNGQIIDSYMAPLSVFANKQIYLGWNDGSVNAHAKITIAADYQSGAVSSWQNFTRVVLYGVR